MHRIFLPLLIILTVASCAHIPQPEFTWPIKKPYTTSRLFSIYHAGVDFPKNTGAPVLSVAKGKVVYTGKGFSGYGNMVLIEHDHSWSSLYAHLHRIDVKTGQAVQKAQAIGAVGSTGRSSGPHLHFELLHEKQVMNPLNFLPESN